AQVFHHRIDFIWSPPGPLDNTQALLRILMLSSSLPPPAACPLRRRADAYVSFSLGPTGDVERIHMKAESPATDFSFDFHDLDLVRQAPQ
ncbi:MAG: hypothetical protein L0Y45_01385, partial [Woeseiaceae bacterium]|nr:hypothetical protein [Woeseiaceae bacterium]